MTTESELALPELDPIVAQFGESTLGDAVRAASPGFDGKARRFLRGLAHSLKPIVQIGKNGLTRGLAQALLEALDDHELIKVKLNDSAPVSATTTAVWIHRTLGVDVIQIVGRTLVVYRPFPDGPEIRLPRR